MTDHNPTPPGPPVEEHLVQPEDLPIRLDGFGVGRFERLASRSAARKAAKRGDLLVDGAFLDSARFLEAGQTVVLHVDRRVPAKVYERELDLAYVDEHVAVVIKPPGLPTNGNKWRTLEHALPSCLPPSSEPDALTISRPVHRLDHRTGGLVVVARTARAIVGLGNAFEHRTVAKRYRALLCGRLDEDVVCSEPIDGRTARTRVVPAQHSRCLTTGWLTTVDCYPTTGRTHQIRKHVHGRQLPILGDDLYTHGRVLRSKGLFLWALELTLPHPVFDETLHVEIPEPAKFGSYRRREQRRYDRWHSELDPGAQSQGSNEIP